jgi:hypothetical protein
LRMSRFAKASFKFCIPLYIWEKFCSGGFHFAFFDFLCGLHFRLLFQNETLLVIPFRFDHEILLYDTACKFTSPVTTS